MKILRTALRVSALFKANLPTIKSKTLPLTLTVGSLGTGYAFWYGSQKVFAEDITNYEVEDNLQEGEMKEIQVGPKP